MKKEELYQITNVLVIEKIARGYSKKYSLAELRKMLPWGKSWAIKKLEKGIEEGILVHEKRKYILNKENERVKRMWNYYNKPTQRESAKGEKIRELGREKKKLKEELEREERMRRKRKYRKLTNAEERSRRREITEYLNEGIETKEMIKKNLMEIIGYKRT